MPLKRFRGKAQLSRDLKTIARSMGGHRDLPLVTNAALSNYWMEKIGEKERLKAGEIEEVQNLGLHGQALQHALALHGQDINLSLARRILHQARHDANKRLQAPKMDPPERIFLQQLAQVAGQLLKVNSDRPPSESLSLNPELLQKISQMNDQRIRVILGNRGFSTYRRAMGRSERVLTKRTSNDGPPKK